MIFFQEASLLFLQRNLNFDGFAHYWEEQPESHFTFFWVRWRWKLMVMDWGTSLTLTNLFSLWFAAFLCGWGKAMQDGHYFSIKNGESSSWRLVIVWCVNYRPAWLSTYLCRITLLSANACGSGGIKDSHCVFLGIFRQDCSVISLKVFEIGFTHSVAQWNPEFLKLFDNSFISKICRSNGIQIYLAKMINEKLYLYWKHWGLYIHLGTKVWRSYENLFFLYRTVFEREKVTASTVLVLSKRKNMLIEYAEFMSSLPPGNWMVFYWKHLSHEKLFYFSPVLQTL